MTEITPYMCSCCEDIWSRENQKNIRLGKYELHLCPDCYREYITSNNNVLDKIRAEIADIYCSQYCENPYTAATIRKMALEIIDKYRAESEVQE